MTISLDILSFIHSARLNSGFYSSTFDKHIRYCSSLVSVNRRQAVTTKTSGHERPFFFKTEALEGVSSEPADNAGGPTPGFVVGRPLALMILYEAEVSFGKAMRLQSFLNSDSQKLATASYARVHRSLVYKFRRATERAATLMALLVTEARTISELLQAEFYRSYLSGVYTQTATEDYLECSAAFRLCLAIYEILKSDQTVDQAALAAFHEDMHRRFQYCDYMVETFADNPAVVEAIRTKLTTEAAQKVSKFQSNFALRKSSDKETPDSVRDVICFGLHSLVTNKHVTLMIPDGAVRRPLLGFLKGCTLSTASSKTDGVDVALPDDLLRSLFPSVQASVDKIVDVYTTLLSLDRTRDNVLMGTWFFLGFGTTCKQQDGGSVDAKSLQAEYSILSGRVAHLSRLHDILATYLSKHNPPDLSKLRALNDHVVTELRFSRMIYSCLLFVHLMLHIMGHTRLCVNSTPLSRHRAQQSIQRLIQLTMNINALTSKSLTSLFANLGSNGDFFALQAVLVLLLSATRKYSEYRISYTTRLCEKVSDRKASEPVPDSLQTYETIIRDLDDIHERSLSPEEAASLLTEQASTLLTVLLQSAHSVQPQSAGADFLLSRDDSLQRQLLETQPRMVSLIRAIVHDEEAIAGLATAASRLRSLLQDTTKAVIGGVVTRPVDAVKGLRSDVYLIPPSLPPPEHLIDDVEFVSFFMDEAALFDTIDEHRTQMDAKPTHKQSTPETSSSMSEVSDDTPEESPAQPKKKRWFGLFG